MKKQEIKNKRLADAKKDKEAEKTRIFRRACRKAFESYLDRIYKDSPTVLTQRGVIKFLQAISTTKSIIDFFHTGQVGLDPDAIAITQAGVKAGADFIAMTDEVLKEFAKDNYVADVLSRTNDSIFDTRYYVSAHIRNGHYVSSYYRNYGYYISKKYI